MAAFYILGPVTSTVSLSYQTIMGHKTEPEPTLGEKGRQTKRGEVARGGRWWWS